MNGKFNKMAYGCAALAALVVSTTAQAQSNVTLTLQVGGKTRHTVFHVPAGAEKPAVVFFIHGANGSGPNFKTETRGDAAADRDKFIAVYPSASSNGNAGVWEDMQGTGNFPFFFAVLDTLDARYKIDRNRVYMTGFSQGGFISFAAGCFYSDKFAAIAPASGHTMANCTIKRPVPVFLTFGATEGIPSFQKDIDSWVKWNDCPTTFKTVAPFPASNANSKATLNSYGPCKEESMVLMNSIGSQGHQWPSSNNMVLADEAWTFFKKYSLPTGTSIAPQDVSQNGNKGHLAFKAGLLRLEGLETSAQIVVTDMSGKLVASQHVGKSLNAGIHEMEFAGHAPGVYQATIREAGKTWSKNFVIP